MAKEKVTVTLDRARAEEARLIVGAKSLSEVIDVALAHLLRVERLRSDIAAYRRTPPAGLTLDLAGLADTAGLADETDWEALYADTAR